MNVKCLFFKTNWPLSLRGLSFRYTHWTGNWKVWADMVANVFIKRCREVRRRFFQNCHNWLKGKCNWVTLPMKTTDWSKHKYHISHSFLIIQPSPQYKRLLCLCCDKPFQNNFFIFKISLMLFIIRSVFYKCMRDRAKNELVLFPPFH